jgi:hypothetical protein
VGEDAFCLLVGCGTDFTRGVILGDLLLGGWRNDVHGWVESSIKYDDLSSFI